MRCFVACLLVTLTAAPLCAQTSENILLVLNEASPVSLEVGQYYAQKRGIPAANVLRIKTGIDDTVSRGDFEKQIETPIATWLAQNAAQDRILYIALTKGIPLRVAGSSGPEGTVASVDSGLTLLYRKMTGQVLGPAGHVANPYFLGSAPVAEAKKFSHESQDLYLVSRLDGYTSADIRALIDRGLDPSREGKILLDQRGSSQDKGNEWLQETAAALDAMGFKDRVVLETTAKVLTDQTGVLGYYSWGSNDPAIQSRHFNLGFVPGALAAMFVSSDARTFAEPPPSWKIGAWGDTASYYAGSPQSLAGDLIREGVTGIAGHVAEPYLEATIRPNILFPAYLAGYNLVEAFYLAMPFLSWQTVVVGDPLCAPFRTQPLSTAEIDKGTDPATELPSLFSARRVRVVAVAAYKQAGVQPDVTKLVIRAESRMARQDLTGARQDLEAATSRDSRLASAQLLLAGLYERAQEYDKAIERYRRLKELAPNNAVVLNNLAYALAVRKNAVEEALPLAEKASSMAKDNPNIMDTLGWIYHLAGQNENAARVLEEAAKRAPQNGEIHLHFAVASSAVGQDLAAEVSLKRALEIDPKLEERDEVRQLRAKLNLKP